MARLAACLFLLFATVGLIKGGVTVTAQPQTSPASSSPFPTFSATSHAPSQSTQTAISSIANDEEDDDDDDDEDYTRVSSSDSSAGGKNGQSEDDAKVYKNPRNSPSVLCPRDDELAEFIGQKCLRKCSNDEDCKSKKKKCLCDGLCGMSCIKPERECTELENPETGRVTLTGRLFNDKAQYTCDSGRHLVGLKERVCRGDGEWSGLAPECRHNNVFCKDAPILPHARHNGLPEQNSFPLETVLQYQCHHGYTTNGFPNAKCLAIDKRASWYGPDISCQPKSCGPPADPSNGWHSGECYTYGCKIEYNCVQGYELVGRAERSCQADAVWTPRDLPACVPVECPKPENPQYGTAIYTSCQYNSVVSYECRYGYTLVGEPTRRCGPDRKWSGLAPKCQVIDCGTPGPLYQGWIENLDGGTGLGASTIFRCHEGMSMVGNSSSVCQLDGTWRYPVPKCLAPCVIPKVDQGRAIFDEANTSVPVTAPNQIPHGHSLEIQCETRYEPNTMDSPLTCNNGTWSHMPKCQPARCKYLPKAPKNGMVIAPKTDHGMKAKFTCKDGFELKGEETTECRYGNWTGHLPHCQEVFCPYPGFVENGKILLVGNMGLYDYRPYVRKVANNKQIMYECNKGYTMSEGPPGATCIGGTWWPRELPKCVPGRHPRLRWSKKRKKRSLLSVLKRLKRALAGQNTQVLKKQTSPGKTDSNAAAAGGSRGRPGTKGVSVTGDDEEGEGEGDDENETDDKGEGGDGDGDSERRTSSKKGKKFRKGKGPFGPPCAPPVESHSKIHVVKRGRKLLSNLTIDQNSYGHGAVLRLVCDPGYSGNLPNSTAKCSRGKWRPETPECTVAPCKIPETRHGVFTTSDAINASVLSVDSATVSANVLNSSVFVEHDHVVEVSCRAGYDLQGSPSMKCWYGQWDIAVLPTCTPAPCQLPIVPHGQYLLGYRPGLSISNGSFVRFQCDAGYKASTLGPLVCVLGELRPAAPRCKIDPGSLYRVGGDITKSGEMGSVDYPAGLRGSCAPPARVQGTLVYRNGEPLAEAERNFPDGTEVTFNCIASIMGEKVTWRIMCQDGSWLGHSLNCVPDEPSKKSISPATFHQFSSAANSQQTRDNTTCLFTNSEPNVATFYQDQPVTEDSVEFPNGAELQFRCSDIGKFALTGSNSRKCTGGKWDGIRPSCFGLNQQYEYMMDKPPTILFRHELGPIAQSNDGKLFVYPGSTLHMECLWIRRFGTPKWATSNNFRKYTEAWNSETGRDPQLEYRLSIVDAVPEDSGTFTCVTPTRHSHTIEIVVKTVHCEPLQARRGLNIGSSDTRMNAKVFLSCSNGNSLIGAQELTCLPSGNWSAPMPVCESMECPDLGKLPDPNLRASILSREVGGQVVFSCQPGYGLEGPLHSTCLPTGDWAQPFPICQEVHCSVPETPKNGYYTGSDPFKAGDLVQFSCNQEFMMEGQPIIACQENGRWSGPVPKCVRACAYPGSVISGTISSVKFYYQIGEVVTFTCDQGRTMQGPSMIKCLKSAKWSHSMPVCT